MIWNVDSLASSHLEQALMNSTHVFPEPEPSAAPHLWSFLNTCDHLQLLPAGTWTSTCYCLSINHIRSMFESCFQCLLSCKTSVQRCHEVLIWLIYIFLWLFFYFHASVKHFEIRSLCLLFSETSKNHYKEPRCLYRWLDTSLNPNRKFI